MSESANDTQNIPTYQQFGRQVKLLIGTQGGQAVSSPDGTIIQADDPKLTTPTDQGGYSGDAYPNKDGTYTLVNAGNSNISAGGTPRVNYSQAGGIDLSNLRIVFTVSRDSVGSPNTANIRVYNLSKQTISKIQKEFSQVVLQVGYKGTALSTIFNGSIIRVARANSASQDPSLIMPGVLSLRENPTDTYMELVATDGDKPYNFATISVSLAANTTAEQQLKSISASLAPYQIGMGYYDLAGSADTVLPRGIVLHGMVKDVLNDFCKFTNTQWSIQEGMLEIVPKDAAGIPGRAIVIGANTGMIGQARETINGVEFTTLLNPYLRVGRVVQLTGQIQQAAVSPPIANGALSVDQIVNPLDPKGFYRVFYFQHTGDTRGNPWYTNCVTRALNAAGPNPAGSGSLKYYS